MLRKRPHIIILSLPLGEGRGYRLRSLSLRRRGLGVALITVLFVLVLLFSMSSAFFFFTGRGVTLTTMSYESLMAQYCAQSGVEYALFLARHNIIIPKTSILQILVNEFTFPSGSNFVKGVGVFRLKELSFDSSNQYLKIEAKGQVFRSIADAQYGTEGRDPVAQRTVEAWIDMRDATGNADVWENRQCYVNNWRERWR
jgi:hypothetical protein